MDSLNRRANIAEWTGQYRWMDGPISLSGRANIAQWTCQYPLMDGTISLSGRANIAEWTGQYRWVDGPIVGSRDNSLANLFNNSISLVKDLAVHVGRSRGWTAWQVQALTLHDGRSRGWTAWQVQALTVHVGRATKQRDVQRHYKNHSSHIVIYI